MSSTQKAGPAVLVVIDGWGLAPKQEKNPIKLAQTPIMDHLWEEYPHAMLGASGSAVGLLPHQDGNSEAGHLNIGAGRIVEQDVLKISNSIEKGTFYKNAAFEQAVQHVTEHESSVHLVGLLTDFNSGHSNPEHLIALVELFRKRKIEHVYLHLFTDGRDTEKFSGLTFVSELEKKLQPNEQIVTIMGRFYGMDRRKSWDRTELAYDTLTLGTNIPKFSSSEEAIRKAYEEGESDEFITPRIIASDSSKPSRIHDNDAVIFFNFRSDRARQLSKVFVQPDFTEKNPKSFTRKKTLENLVFVAMTDFGPDLDSILTAFPSEDLEGTLPYALGDLRQLYIAESEKFAHITFFFNGGHADPVAGEERMLIPSPNVKSYDETPEMATPQITDTIIEKIENDEYDFIAANFANADMVGHTGNLEASLAAVKSIDENIGRLVKAVLAKNGHLFITADHGNVEEIITGTGGVDTEHSTNPVPFIIVSNHPHEQKKLGQGVLGHIAPTVLHCMEVQKPWQMVFDSIMT
ncbi:MAG: 2,3-bisphosphoglycerate-independent phosphoglycerate mutase [Patescibacteria group bacterium]